MTFEQIDALLDLVRRNPDRLELAGRPTRSGGSPPPDGSRR
jgi:hypothetical protein